MLRKYNTDVDHVKLVLHYVFLKLLCKLQLALQLANWSAEPFADGSANAHRLPTFKK